MNSFVLMSTIASLLVFLGSANALKMSKVNMTVPGEGVLEVTQLEFNGSKIYLVQQNGNEVETEVIPAGQDYNIVKKDGKCIVRFKSSVNSSCYEGTKPNEADIPQGIKDECDGAEIIYAHPTSCTDQTKRRKRGCKWYCWYWIDNCDTTTKDLCWFYYCLLYC